LFQRVAGKPRPLSFYVDFALTNYREPENQKSLADAILGYVAAEKRASRGELCKNTKHVFRIPITARGTEH
jgi:hypothetical protein